MLSNGSERTSPAPELTDLCTEQTLSSEAICDIPTQNGSVIQSEDVQQVHEDGNSFLSGCVENSESQTSPAKESMGNKHSYSVVQINGPNNCSSEMHLSEAEDLHLPANCDSNDLPLTLSETTSLNMFES